MLTDTITATDLETIIKINKIAVDQRYNSGLLVPTTTAVVTIAAFIATG